MLTVEYKMNLVAPADGDKLIARGQVVRPGRTSIVTTAEGYAVKGGRQTRCALMQQTIRVMHGRAEKQAGVREASLVLPVRARPGVFTDDEAIG